MVPLVGFLGAYAILMFVMGVATPTLALALERAGISGGVAGLVLASHHVGFAATALVAGPILGRFGARRALGIAGFSLGAAVFMQAGFESPWLLGVGRAIGGSAVAVACLAIEPGLGALAGRRRGLVLGAYLVVGNLALCAGPPLASFGLSVLVPVSALAVAVILPAALVPARRTRAVGPGLDLRLLVSAAPGATLAAFAGGAATSALFAVGPLWGLRLGLSPAEGALLVVALVAAGGIAPLPLGLLADRTDRDRVIRFTSTGCAAAGLAAALSPTPAAFVFAAVASAFAFSLYPLGVGLAQDRLDADELLRASGGMLLAFAAGSVLGPPVAGFLVESRGPAALPLWVAVSGSLAVLGPATRGWAARWRRGARPPLPAKPVPSSPPPPVAAA